jgi:hypothetical protein
MPSAGTRASARIISTRRPRAGSGWDGRRYRVLNQEKDAIPAEVLASVFKTVRAIQDEAHFVRATGVPEDEEIDPRRWR